MGVRKDEMPFDVMYVEDSGYVAGTLMGDMEEKDLNAARNKMNAELVAHGCKKLLVDATGITQMQSVFADFDFTEEHQTELPLGTRHAVVIRPERKGHMQFVEDVAQNRAINLRLFTDRHDAIEWLTDGERSD